MLHVVAWHHATASVWLPQPLSLFSHDAAFAQEIARILRDNHQLHSAVRQRTQGAKGKPSGTHGLRWQACDTPGSITDAHQPFTPEEDACQGSQQVMLHIPPADVQTMSSASTAHCMTGAETPQSRPADDRTVSGMPVGTSISQGNLLGRANSGLLSPRAAAVAASVLGPGALGRTRSTNDRQSRGGSVMDAAAGAA